MKQLFLSIILSILIISVISIPITTTIDYTEKQYKDECNNVVNKIQESKELAKKFEYFYVFGKALYDGVKILQKITDEKIQNNNDENKQQAINFAYESCKRAILFLNDALERFDK